MTRAVLPKLAHGRTATHMVSVNKLAPRGPTLPRPCSPNKRPVKQVMHAASEAQRMLPGAKTSFKSPAVPSWVTTSVQPVLWLGACLRRGVVAVAAVLATWYARLFGRTQALPQQPAALPTETPESAPVSSSKQAPVASQSTVPAARRPVAALLGTQPQARSRSASLTALTAPTGASSPAATVHPHSYEQRLAFMRQRLEASREETKAQQAHVSRTFAQLAAKDIHLNRAEHRLEALGRRIADLEGQVAEATSAWQTEAELRDRAEAELKILRRNAKNIGREADARVAEAQARLEDAELRLALSEARADRALSSLRPSSPSQVAQADLVDHMARLSLNSPSLDESCAADHVGRVYRGQGAAAAMGEGTLFARPKGPGFRVRRANKSAS